MKKFLSLIVIAIMLLAVAVPASALEKNDSIGVVPSVDTAPVVDGVVDDVYNNGLKFVLAKNGSDFEYTDSENATPTVYMVYNGNNIYVCVDVEYDTPLEPYNEYMDQWRQECVEVFMDWYNDSDLGDVKVGKANTVVIKNLIQYRVDLDGNFTGGTVFNSTKNTSQADMSPYFTGAATKSDELTHCTYEFAIISQVDLTEGTHIGINIVLQDLINSGANFNWYRHADNWKAGLYPYFEIGAAAGNNGGDNNNNNNNNGGVTGAQGGATEAPETKVVSVTDDKGEAVTDNSGNQVTQVVAETKAAANKQNATATSDVTLIASASLLVMAAATVVVAKSRKH